MQVSETLNEGLKREIKIVVPADDLKAKLENRLVELKSRVRLNGFRPGKGAGCASAQALRKIGDG